MIYTSIAFCDHVRYKIENGWNFANFSSFLYDTTYLLRFRDSNLEKIWPRLGQMSRNKSMAVCKFGARTSAKAFRICKRERGPFS